MTRPLHIITTHKSTDFDALASVVAAGMLYPQAVTVLPQHQNPNVRAFLSLHKDLFEYCLANDIDFSCIDRLVVVDTNAWSRLDRMENLREKSDMEIHVYDHHGQQGNIIPTRAYQAETGANITLMLRFLKKRNIDITPLQATLFLTGLYEDTGNLTFPSTTAEDAHAAAYLLEHGGDLNVMHTFLSPIYGQKHKDTLFRMLGDAERTTVNGHNVSINRCPIKGYLENLSVVLQMYRRILNVDAAFGIYSLDHDRCLIIGRSNAMGIDIGSVMRCFGGGGHKGAGSAMLRSVDPVDVETWIRLLLGEQHGSNGTIRDLMTHPVFTLEPDLPMQEARIALRRKRVHGAPVVERDRIRGMISIRDFRKTKRKDVHHPVKAFMSTRVITIEPWRSPAYAAQVMVRHDVGRLPVIDSGKPVGIISRSDVMNHLYGFCPVGSSLTKGCQQSVPDRFDIDISKILP
ncbi:MAG: CBS domain-containing protein [Thermodesulfobacteriota bacterium]